MKIWPWPKLHASAITGTHRPGFYFTWVGWFCIEVRIGRHYP